MDMYSAEDPSYSFDFSEKSIRAGFIRKVYSILMCQLLITTAVIVWFTFHEPTKIYAQNHSWILIVGAVLTLVCLLCMTCCVEVRRNFPMNFIFLFVFTCAESLLLGAASSKFDGYEVLIAMGMCATLSFLLTVFAFQTKIDFTKWGGALLIILIVFTLFGILTIFIKGRTMQMFYASIGACIFMLYIIYDTQLMMGGSHKYSISPEEYIFAALNLYLDVINLFIFLLQIIGMSRD
ncbi:protein lifeguard 1-like [Rhodnius prolixus]|uniref:protein lifeguard 1-like n=1 Tax=Rhodnius prolixus TaxID=13249 RepID=UPI003D18CD69